MAASDAAPPPPPSKPHLCGEGVFLFSAALKFVASYKLPPDGGVFLCKEASKGSKK